MQCMSCETEVNPKWQHAIEQNSCPFCGNHIMDEVLKDLLSTLSHTMAQLQSYPDQFDDWMLSNYSFIRTYDPNLPNFLPDDYRPQRKGSRKIKTLDENGEQIETEIMLDEESTNKFFERTQIKSISNPAEFTKSMKEKKEKAKYEQPSGGYSDLDPEIGEFFTNSSTMDEFADENLPDDSVLKMMNNINNKKVSKKPVDEVEALISKVNSSKENFNSGAGGFRRTD